MATYRKHLLENLENWTLSGGRWRVVSISNERAVVDLCACTGEPMERLESDDPAAIGSSAHNPLHPCPEAVERYIDEVARVGFDLLEISAGFISIPTDDMLRLVERVQRAGLKAKPEVGIQFGAGGATTPAELEQEAPAMSAMRSTSPAAAWTRART
jgi:hypothetical protein